MDNGWGIAMVLGMLAIWALVVVAIVWIIRSTTAAAVPPAVPGGSADRGASAGSATATAEQILAERLARGDIEVEEYRTRLEALTMRGT
jgi:putative membrane protein